MATLFYVGFFSVLWMVSLEHNLQLYLPHFLFPLVVVVEVQRQCSYQRWWLSEWVTPGGTAILGMTSVKDGDLQHSSALAQSPKGDNRAPTISQKLIRILVFSNLFFSGLVDGTVSIWSIPQPGASYNTPMNVWVCTTLPWLSGYVQHPHECLGMYNTPMNVWVCTTLPWMSGYVQHSHDCLGMYNTPMNVWVCTTLPWISGYVQHSHEYLGMYNTPMNVWVCTTPPWMSGYVQHSHDCLGMYNTPMNVWVCTTLPWMSGYVQHSHECLGMYNTPMNVWVCTTLPWMSGYVQHSHDCLGMYNTPMNVWVCTTLSWMSGYVQHSHECLGMYNTPMNVWVCSLHSNMFPVHPLLYGVVCIFGLVPFLRYFIETHWKCLTMSLFCYFYTLPSL